jgi:hypothetical protein
MRRLLIPIILLALAACGGPDLRTLNLEDVLIQDGDLPAGMTAGQITDGSTGDTTSANGFVSRAERRIAPDGSVTVLVYEDGAALQRDFERVLPGVTADGMPNTDVGTRAVTRGNIVMFVRCHALVIIRFAVSRQMLDQAMGYAKRLDSRLTPLVC